MKAMWSAASGMKGLQTKIDTIANNLANVNTTGFKKQRVEFKDMLYEQVSQINQIDGDGRPVNIEVGHGVITSATTRSFGAGNFEQTNNELDMAINGDGFFVIEDAQGRMRYSRDGAFKLSIEDGIASLVTADGYAVQGIDGPIELGEDIAGVEVDKAGNIVVERGTTGDKETVGQFLIAKFPNPAGLESHGTNLFSETEASGIAATDEDSRSAEVWQGFLESSNVQVVEEMINMITAQRAYELNSKTIQTADRILELANNLSR